MVESVVLLATICQFLCVMAVSCLAMPETGVIMERMLVFVCGVRWDKRQLWLWVKAFFMFLMMRCSGLFYCICNYVS